MSQAEVRPLGKGIARLPPEMGWVLYFCKEITCLYSSNRVAMGGNMTIRIGNNAYALFLRALLMELLYVL